MSDSVFTNVYKIEDNSLPSIKEGFIKKDEIRFDEPKAETDDVPFGSMELAVDPDDPIKVEPGKSVQPEKVNTDEELKKIAKHKLELPKKSVLRFSNDDDSLAVYQDPRVPKDNTKKIKLDKPEEDL